MTDKNIDTTALHAALDAIEELNQTMTDENGHRWDRSDLIGQEIRAMRGIIRGAAESPRVINAFHPDVESYGLGWPQAECLIVSVQATDRAAQLAGQTLAKWLEQADGQPLSQECCEKLAHIIRSSVIEPARSILLATSQPAPALDVTGAAPDAHQIDLTTAGAQQAQEPVAVKVSECASEGCGNPSSVHFIRGDIGSHYCMGCYLQVQKQTSPALAASQPAPETLNAAYNRGYEDCLYSAGQTAEPESRPVTLTYTNWKGETAERTIIPRRVWWGSTEWHPEPQWLLTALDMDKGSERDFALKDFGQPAQPVAVKRLSQREIAEIIRKNEVADMTKDGDRRWVNRMAEALCERQYSTPQPLTVQDAARVLLTSSDRGVCVGGRWDGWLMIRHPDGHWVSHHKLDAVDPRTEMTDALRAIAEGRA